MRWRELFGMCAKEVCPNNCGAMGKQQTAGENMKVDWMASCWQSVDGNLIMMSNQSIHPRAVASLSFKACEMKRLKQA